MTENIYSAPTSDLGSGNAADNEDGANKFYVVAPYKFLTLFFVTLGLYKIYWFYKNWARFKAYTQEDLWPVPRAIFTIFFTHQLFERVDSQIQRQGYDFQWQARSTATFFVVAQLISTALDRASAKTDNIALTGLSLAILLIVVIPLFTAQKAINAACGDPEGRSNAKLTGPNWAWIIIGLLLWGLAVFGMFANKAA